MFGGAGRRSWPTCRAQSLRPPGVRPADELAAADAVPAARARPWSHRILHRL